MKANATTMRFGRYKGWNVKDVPKNYLEWVAKQPGLTSETKAGVRAALSAQPKRTDIPCAGIIATDFKSAACGPDA